MSSAARSVCVTLCPLSDFDVNDFFVQKPRWRVSVFLLFASWFVVRERGGLVSAPGLCGVGVATVRATEAFDLGDT